jgi:hypothetical protein
LSKQEFFLLEMSMTRFEFLMSKQREDLEYTKKLDEMTSSQFCEEVINLYESSKPISRTISGYIEKRCCDPNFHPWKD